MSTDADLLQRFRDTADRGALDELFGRHYPSIFHVLLRICGNEFDARDLAQVTFLKALASLEQYRGDGAFRPWLIKIAVNEFRNQRRRTRPVTTSDTVFEMYSELKQEHAQQAAERAEFERALHDALNGFPEDLRVPLVLYYYQDLSTADIANALDIPKSTAHDRIRLALEKLRRAFTDKGFHSLLPLVGKFFPGIRLTAEPAVAASGSATGLSAGSLALGALAMKLKLAVAAAVVVLFSLASYLMGLFSPPDLFSNADLRKDAPAVVSSEPPAARETPAATSSEAGGTVPESTGGAAPRHAEIHSEGPGSVTGQVQDRSTRKPVAGVEITVVPVSSAEDAHITPQDDSYFQNLYFTDDNGRFICGSLPIQARFQLRLRHNDYAYLCQSFFLENASPQNLETLLLDSALTLTGLVTDTDGRPIAGAHVTAGEYAAERFNPFAPTYTSRGLLGATAETGADGRFQLSGLAEGIHRLEVSKAGYAPLGIPTVRVTPESSHTPLHIALSAGQAVAGRVEDESGNPVADAQVELMIQEGVHIGSSGISYVTPFPAVRTDEYGQFLSGPIPADAKFLVHLNVSAEGFFPGQARDIRAGDEGVRVRMARRGDLSIQGKIVDSGNNLIEAIARVRAWTGDPPVMADEVVTAGDGSFEVGNLSPGPARIEVAVIGYKTAATELHVTNLNQAVTVKLTPGLTLSGRILDESTLQPIAGATVYDMLSGVMIAGNTNSCVTDADGRFTLTGLSAYSPPAGYQGTNAIKVCAPGYRDLDPVISLSDNADIQTVDLSMQKAETYLIRGRVVDTSDAPVENAWVVFGRKDGSTMQSRTDQRGRFSREFVDTGGQFPEFFDMNSDRSRLSACIIHPDFAPLQTRIDVESMDQELKFTLERGASMKGSITSQDGLPLPDAGVMAVWLADLDATLNDRNLKSEFESYWFLNMMVGDDRAGNPYTSLSNAGKRFVICDARGDFLLDRLAPGQYWIFPFAPNFNFPENAKHSDYLINVDAGQTGLNFSLRAGGSVSGKVIDDAGRPVKGAFVRPQGPGGCHTNAAGEFHLDCLFKDPVTITVDQPGFSRASETVSFNTSDLILTVTPVGTLRGRLIDADTGDILAGMSVVARRENAPLEDRSCVSFANGFFSLAVPVGNYTLLVSSADPASPRGATSMANIHVQQGVQVQLGDIPVQKDK